LVLVAYVTSSLVYSYLLSSINFCADEICYGECKSRKKCNMPYCYNMRASFLSCISSLIRSVLLRRREQWHSVRWKGML